MEDTTTKLNGATYEYKYRLYNGAGQELVLRDSIVTNLLYEESLFDPFPDGAITIANPSNFIDSQFIYRGDGSDKIDIFLKDKATNDEIKSTFTLVGEKNIVDDSTPIRNSKMYYFMDEHEAMLLRKFPYGRVYSGKAGKIIKDILKEFKFTIDEDSSGKEIFEEGDFALTSTDPFVPSINYRYIDVIYYLLQYYYYKDGDTPVKGILSKERNGKYVLKTMSKDYFEKNSKLLTEAFHSGEVITRQDATIGSEDNPNTPADTPADRTIGNLTSIALDKFSVDDSNQFFMNTNVMSYDDILGEYHIDQIRIKDVRDEWEKKFVKKFPMAYGDPVKHLPMTKEKLEGEFKTYRLPYDRVSNVNIVKANMINDFIFRNNQIIIVTNGRLARQPGTFIDILNAKKGVEDPLLLGRWFVTGVEHIKIGATYRNVIKAIKTFAGPTYKKVDKDV